MSVTDELTADLGRQVKAIVADLRKRSAEVPDIRAKVEGQWREAHDAGRTSAELPEWSEGLLAQVAVAWVLATVFVRFAEDNGLLAEPLLSGPGERRRQAETAQTVWYRDHEDQAERGYAEHVVREAARRPGLAGVFGAHNPLWLFGPSDDAMRELLAFWRDIDADGRLRRDFTDPTWDTRFLGDLYQNLSEHARKQYALLQTPHFVEQFILDRTLDPAIEEFGLADFRMIDPACGSGHFLLGAFERLLARWQERAPQDGNRALAERALRSVYGIDLNPFAASIARFRLVVAALRAADVRTLDESPNFTLNVAVGDSLLHGPPPGQQTLLDIEQHDPATNHLYATEDSETIGKFLEQRYHAVVANPPYIVGDDAAARDVYRRRYRTAYRQFSLAVPFMERLFDLAVRGNGAHPAGFVGQITANSFMKREFGKKVIEEFLAEAVDLAYVLDTSRAHLPGHATSTVILLGRNRPPLGDIVRAVLGIRGESSRPADPEKGRVWTSIVSLLEQPGSEDEYVSIQDLDRSRLAKHPWSLQGGGANELKESMEAARGRRVESVAAAIGRTTHTAEDDAFFIPPAGRLAREVGEVVPLVKGDVIRDHLLVPDTLCVFPYDVVSGEPVEPTEALARHFWTLRTRLEERRDFGQRPTERGLRWFDHSMFFRDRYQVPQSVAFAFVATHNHFVLDRGAKLFKQSAPVIKLPVSASEDDHLELLGPLNSAVGCFWMKQVCQDKGVGGIGGGIGDEAWEPRYEFDGTKLKQFPLPEGSALEWARCLDSLAQELTQTLPAAVVGRGTPDRKELEAARLGAAVLRSEMVAAQEELDWRCLFLYGVNTEDLSMPPDAVPALEKGHRAFEIVLARKMKAGEVTTTWFERHGSEPITELPGHWPPEYRDLVERRIELIENDRYVGLVERPEYKRRWNWAEWADLEAEALRTWLLDRLEDPRYWPDLQPRSAARLADMALAADPDFVQVARLYAGIDVDLPTLVGRLVSEESVPYLAARRYTPSGRAKRAEWERTWDLQRQEDKGEEVGRIPVPPKYGKTDFRQPESWKLRGQLDVPKERFIAYPGAERADGSPVVGWAGWNHLQAAQALATLYEQRRAQEGWAADRLLPLVAGVAELVPWLRQWHNEVDPATGVRLGDFFADFVRNELHTLGASHDEMVGWEPPKAATRRRRART